MKSNIHPKWVKTQITCACGNTFETGGTKPMLRVEVCSKCHPFFTGQQRIVDTAGQVDRFMRRLGHTQRSEGRRTQETGGAQS
jgi:large subunit ribosomal protein L31